MPASPQEPVILPPPAIVSITAGDTVSVDPKSGIISVEEDDGSVTIDLAPGASEARSAPSKFYDNLADRIDASELARIADDLLRGIRQDDQSRQEMLQTFAKGLRMLGLKIDNPRTSIDTTAALEGMSSVVHPMLLEAVLNFQANASGELLPAGGPVKVMDALGVSAASIEQAENLERDLNYYLTTIATEYYPDTDRALLVTGFAGCTFKKVYFCPLRERPVSESVDSAYLIVSNTATDLRNCGRVTQVITMRPSILKRMQLTGAYRKVDLSQPVGEMPNPVQQQVQAIQGTTTSTTQQTEDRDHTIYETYCELNIRAFEDKRAGKETGLLLPYRVVIEKDSQQVLEVRRNWREDDPNKLGKICFVQYPYVPGFGFYGIGLLHILGNTNNALTAGWREMLDAGMFANFPGFLYAKIMGRQNSNELRVAPGSGVAIETNGQPIKDAIMPLPYKDVSTAFTGFLQHIEETGQRVGGTANVKVAEGRQDAPVGTTLAMLEQATRVESAAHKRLWRAQSEEFRLLKESFREHPESFVKAIAARGGTPDWSAESFVAALDDCSLVPQADPNTPSHMHRLMKAMGLIQLDKAYPGVLDPVGIVKRVVSMLGFGDFNSLAMKQGTGPGGPPPELMVEMQKLELESAKLQDKGVERQFKTILEQMRAKLEQAKAGYDQQRIAAEGQLQARESQDQELQHRTDLEQSRLSLRETEIDAAARVDTERLRGQTEETKGKHAVATAKAKPAPKMGGKK